MKKLPKIVIDTNLLVASHFNKKSASFKILKLIQKRKVKNYWSRKIKEEGERIVFGNIKANKNFLKKFQSIFQKECEVINPPKIKLIREDPSDNIFLSVALASGADFIISNDFHLLCLKSFETIKIVKPSQFLSLIQNEIKENYF